MKKISIFISALLLIVMCFAACAPKLPEGMTLEDVESAGENVIILLNEKNYDGFMALCDKTVSDLLTATPISDAWEPFYTELGAYDSIEKAAVTSQSGFAVYVGQAKYANKSATFTISFDKDYKVSGIYFK